MPPLSILLVQESLLNFRVDEAFIKRFYMRFFAIAPEIKILFPMSMDEYATKFKNAFEVLFNGVADLEQMKETLKNLGSYHAQKHVRPEYFPIFKKAIIATLRDELKDSFNADTEQAWSEYLDKIIYYMRYGMAAGNVSAEDMLRNAGSDNVEEATIREFKDADAMLTGHFILSSGLHSPTYLQCARVTVDAKRGERLCAMLADKVRKWEILNRVQIDVIVAPAMGGVIVGYETGRQLGIDAMFCERVGGKFMLRRGFELEEGQKVLVVEDVVTTGKSSMEAVECINSFGAKAVAVASLIDRRDGNDVTLTLPLISLLKLAIPTYQPDALPPELQNIPAIKPGSRDLKK